MAQSLMAIAAFCAVVGGIIFGVSRYEKSNAKEDSIEQVITPQPEPTPSQANSISVALTPEVSAEEIDVTPEPRSEDAKVILPPTIQDPKRPNDSTTEELTQEILAWGQSKELKHVSKLMQYTTHADSIVRGNAAIALGQIARQNSVRSDVERSIPVLGKLTQDTDLKVRLYAVQALGEIRSEKVLPYLEKALQSPSGSVMKAANGAIQNLKLQYGKTPAMQIAQTMLEKTKKTIA